jgi:hypothetical protein
MAGELLDRVRDIRERKGAAQAALARSRLCRGRQGVSGRGRSYEGGEKGQPCGAHSGDIGHGAARRDPAWTDGAAARACLSA